MLKSLDTNLSDWCSGRPVVPVLNEDEQKPSERAAMTVSGWSPNSFSDKLNFTISGKNLEGVKLVAKNVNIVTLTLYPSDGSTALMVSSNITVVKKKYL